MEVELELLSAQQYCQAQEPLLDIYLVLDMEPSAALKLGNINQNNLLEE
ncbi:hypothetical protein [Paenibacillus lacisoli]|nr:hypothetical protein [Paenibacillus sp. JX-17]